MARFFDSLTNFVRQGQEEAEIGPQRIGVDGLRIQPRWSQVEVEWDSLRRRLESVSQTLHGLVKELAQAGWDQQSLLLETLGKLEQAHEQLSELCQQISRVIFQPVSSRQEQVGWLEVEPMKRGKQAISISFCVAPIFISDLLERQIFHKRRGVVLTGATLRTDEGFEFMQERLGCWDANYLVVESPFDYRKNALLYLPSDMPTPDRPGYQQAVERAIVDAARSAQGRTLVLFTSYGHLRATANPIRRALDQEGITLLEHGFSGRSRLLREFRTGKRSVLMGTGTFWEGIDLPGEMLSCLVIVRLPFAVPTDPLFAARSRVYDDPFNDYTVPDAVLRFRQGFGRLIRTTTDRGVVVLLDSRAWQRSYGSAFLDALPGCTLRRSPLASLADSVEQWLALGDWSGRGWPGTDSDTLGTLW
jgi:DNA polymerase-3 subunit epsilon/ATP-dependent DNA helicase DinG